MKTPEEIQHKYYTDTAAEYDNSHLNEDDSHYLALKYSFHLLQAEGVKSVLDVGCGTGRTLKYLRERGLEVHGIEPVQALLDQATQRHGIPSELLTCGSGTKLPFEDNSFDAVCEFGVLHHVADPDAVLQEMMRVARKVVFISDGNRFGQGRIAMKWAKLILHRTRLWNTVNFVQTRGKKYFISEGDGLAYSYSTFDSLPLLTKWADRVAILPTTNEKSNSWFYPLLSASQLLFFAVKEREESSLS